MEQYIDKAVVVAEIERRKKKNEEWKNSCKGIDSLAASMVIQEDINILSFLETLKVKEVNIAEMADEYYDALMKETGWMDEGTMGHCRLAYYTGCKDVLNKIRKGE